MRTKSFTRDERKRQIIIWFAMRIQKGNYEYASMNAIARGLGMSPSSHLTKILFEMNNEGTIALRGVSRPGKWFGNEFMLMPGTYQVPHARIIPLKLNGKDQGQLELF
jgi:hypothetical protein